MKIKIKKVFSKFDVHGINNRKKAKKGVENLAFSLKSARLNVSIIIYNRPK